MKNIIILIVLLFGVVYARSTICESSFLVTLKDSIIPGGAFRGINLLRRLIRGVVPYVKIYLYSRIIRNGQIIKYNDGVSLKNSDFKSNNPTRFIIHGFQNDRTSPVNQIILKSYLDRADYNVIIIDWGQLSNLYFFDYEKAVEFVSPVGIFVAKFIDFLVQEGGTQISKISIVGHSLGAHVSGIAGKHVTTGRIPAIVGLDPAGPCFTFENKKTRIDASDAEYVEIIHTNGGTFRLGLFDPIGTADFYPNGGTVQKGCTGLTCAHGRAYEYFAESVAQYREPYIGIPCKETEVSEGKCTLRGKMTIMGGDPPKNRQESFGIYYVRMNS